MSKPRFYLVEDRNGDLLRLTPEALAKWNALGQPPLRGEISSKSPSGEQASQSKTV